MKSSNQCKILKAEFSKEILTRLDKDISNLNLCTSIDETLNNLDNIFMILKSSLPTLPLIKLPEMHEGLSHVKSNYLTLQTDKGELIFEVIKFTGNQSTGLHTHPEFLIDEIIEGSIEELNYKENSDGNYIYCGRDIRQVGSMRRTHTTCGLPHDVCAKDSPCISFALSLGKRSVETIASEKAFREIK